jgi:hypothetical protein
MNSIPRPTESEFGKQNANLTKPNIKCKTCMII